MARSSIARRAFLGVVLLVPLGMLGAWGWLVRAATSDAAESEAQLWRMIEDQGPSNYARVLAAKTLALEVPGSLPRLEKLLESPDPVVQRIVLLGLASARERARPILPRLLQLCSHQDPGVAGAALRAAVEIAPTDRGVLAALRQAIRAADDSTDKDLAIALQCLNPRPAEVVFEALESRADRLSLAAQDVVDTGEIEWSEVKAAVTRWLPRATYDLDSSPWRNVFRRHRAEFVPAFQHVAREHPVFGVRLSALEYLIAEKQPIAGFLPWLRQSVEGSADPNLRGPALRLLSRVVPEGVAILRDFTRSSDTILRYSAYFRLEQDHHERVPLAILTAGLRESGVELQCISALAKRRPASMEAIPELEELAAHPQFGRAARNAIGKIRWNNPNREGP